MKPGRLGVWSFTDGMSAADAGRFAQRLEDLAYSTLWIPEASGRHPFVHAGWLLANTTCLQVATGIASIYNRDAASTMAGALALAEQSGARFLLGLGVSHQPVVEGVRGHRYGKPVSTMSAYLDAMERARYAVPRPAEPPPVVLAALGGNMLALAAARTQGAHTYFASPEHTASARRTVGPDAWLCVEQKVILETDASRARRWARHAAARYMGLENYRRNWRRLGFEETDLADGGTDRFIDRLIAWGDAPSLEHRIRSHRDAGADHVCIQPIGASDTTGEPDWRLLEALAPASA